MSYIALASRQNFRGNNNAQKHGVVVALTIVRATFAKIDIDR